MAGADSIRAGKAHVEVGGDDTPLAGVLRALQGKLSAWGDNVRNMGMAVLGAGLAMAAPLGAAALTFAEMGDDMAKMSGRTGVAVEALSELRYAATQSGASVEELEAGLTKMARFMNSEMTPAKMRVMDELGLSIDDLKKMKPEDQMLAFADAISKVQDPSQRAALAMEVFGKGGTRLLPMMADGAAGIRQLMEQGRALGLTMSTEDANAAVVFGDKLADLKSILKAITFQVGAGVTPVLQRLIDIVTPLAVSVSEWTRENRSLFGWLMSIALGTMAVGAALIKVGTIMKGLSLGVGGIISVFSVLSPILATIGVPLLALAAAGLALWGAMELLGMTFGDLLDNITQAWQSLTAGIDLMDLLTIAIVTIGGMALVGFGPLITLVAIVVAQFFIWKAAIDAVIDNWDALKAAAQSALSTVKDLVGSTVDAFRSGISYIAGLFPGITAEATRAWNDLLAGASMLWDDLRGVVGSGVEAVRTILADFTTAYGGISDAIAAGDWAGAFEIGWLALQVAFQTGKNWLLGQWSDLKFNMLTMWDSLVAALGPTISTALQAIVGHFFDMAEAIVSVINSIVSALPQNLRDRLGIGELAITGRAAAMAGISSALEPGPQRTRDGVDRSEEERLRAQLEERRQQAAFGADWQRMVDAGMNVYAPESADQRQGMLAASGVSGSFSAAALSAFGGGSPAERTASAVEILVQQLIPGVERVGDLIEDSEGGVAVE